MIRKKSKAESIKDDGTKIETDGRYLLEHSTESKDVPAADLDIRSALGITDPNAVVPDDPVLYNIALQRAANEKENEQRAKLEAKRQEEDRRRMAEYERQQRERRDDCTKNLW